MIGKSIGNNGDFTIQRLIQILPLGSAEQKTHSTKFLEKELSLLTSSQIIQKFWTDLVESSLILPSKNKMLFWPWFQSSNERSHLKAVNESCPCKSKVSGSSQLCGFSRKSWETTISLRRQTLESPQEFCDSMECELQCSRRMDLVAQAF